MTARALTAVLPATALAALAWASGGYFPRTWGAALLAAAIAIAAAALLARPVEHDRRARALLGGLGALAVWALASRLWGDAPDASVLEAQRTLLAAGTALAALLWVGRERADGLVLGVLLGAGTASVGGLAGHAFGAGVPPERLEAPVGYTNAAGILAAVTILLGAGLVPERPRARTALVVAPTVPAAAALYLSLSRGSIVALALGLVLLAAGVRSLGRATRIALTLLPALAGVGLVAATDAFDDPGVTAAEVVVAGALAGLAAAAVGAALLVARVRVPTPGRRTLALVSAAALAVGAVALVVAVREVGGVRTSPAAQQGAPDRLLSTSTSSRSEYWAVAAGMVADAPLLGAGAGSFERHWLRERPALLWVRDAHNLYLETLAELGPVGLAALLLALLSPLLATRAALAAPAGPAALATYLALLAHAALDWDWELPAVSLCAILLGIALVRLGGSGIARVPTIREQAGLLAVAVALGAVAVVAHAGNGAAAEAQAALDRGDAVRAAVEADRARRFSPWAAEPWRLRGEAALVAGDVAAARNALRRAVEDDPQAVAAWLALALVTTGAERSTALERARALDPLSPELAAIAARP